MSTYPGLHWKVALLPCSSFMSFVTEPFSSVLVLRPVHCVLVQVPLTVSPFQVIVPLYPIEHWHAKPSPLFEFSISQETAATPEVVWVHEKKYQHISQKMLTSNTDGSTTKTTESNTRLATYGARLSAKRMRDEYQVSARACVCVCVRMYLSMHVYISHIYSCARVRANKPLHDWLTEGQAWTVFVTRHVTLLCWSSFNAKPG